MSQRASERTRWVLVVVFAIAMAWVEAASVYYIRAMVDRIVPYQPDPLPIQGIVGRVELVREASTLVMLLAVGMLAAQAWGRRLAYAAIAFGTWDIFYYVFLRVITDWPQSLFDWDILFLLPLPWWGPVLAPVSIALLMIVWGTVATQFPDRGPALSLPWTSWGAVGVGIAVSLYVFMADALHAVQRGLDATRTLLPDAFNWPLFLMALVLMATPVAQMAWRVRAHRS
jgi:hypothetical protein